MRKHTPGPLKVKEMGTHFAIVDVGYENVIAESVLYREDAELYATAPKMFDALEKIELIDDGFEALERCKDIARTGLGKE